MADFRALAEALDPERVRREWERAGGVPIRAVRPLRAIPSRSGSAALAYEIDTEDGMRSVCGRWFDASQPLPQPEPGHVLLRRLRVLLVPPRADAGLPGLRAVLDPRARREIDAFRALRRPRATLLAHRPGKRASLRIDGEDRSGRRRTLFVKALPPRRAADLAARCLALRRFGLSPPGAVVVPRVVGFEEKLGLLILDWDRAPSLHDRLSQGDLAPAIERVGCALGRLHGIALSSLAAHTHREEQKTLELWQCVLESVAPSQAPRARRLLRRLERSLGRAQPLCTSHGDFHDKQILIGVSRLTLLDLDQMCRAEPSRDRGNFVAHLFLREVQGHLSQGESARLGEAFRRGCGRDGSRRRERWYEAAATIRLAGLYGLRPAHASLTPRLLDRAEAILEGA